MPPVGACDHKPLQFGDIKPKLINFHSLVCIVIWFPKKSEYSKHGNHYNKYDFKFKSHIISNNTSQTAQCNNYYNNIVVNIFPFRLFFTVHLYIRLRVKLLPALAYPNSSPVKSTQIALGKIKLQSSTRLCLVGVSFLYDYLPSDESSKM